MTRAEIIAALRELVDDYRLNQGGDYYGDDDYNAGMSYGAERASEDAREAIEELLARVDKPKIKVGQVWASTDKRDIRMGVRQHRVVTEVPGPGDSRHGYAFLETPGSRFTGSFGIKIDKRGNIDRHRLVQDVS